MPASRRWNSKERPPEVKHQRLAISTLLALNAVPLIGVLQFNWASFDLIFLYWLENLVIGGFVVLRMLVRPRRHPLIE